MLRFLWTQYETFSQIKLYNYPNYADLFYLNMTPGLYYTDFIDTEFNSLQILYRGFALLSPLAQFKMKY